MIDAIWSSEEAKTRTERREQDERRKGKVKKEWFDHLVGDTVARTRNDTIKHNIAYIYAKVHTHTSTHTTHNHKHTHTITHTNVNGGPHGHNVHYSPENMRSIEKWY